MPTPFEAVERETLQEAAYRQIRAVLMSGGLAAGEKVTIRGLAGDLGMSWTPIREAVRRLAAEGALEVSPNRWIRVPNLSADELGELKTIRLMLEGHAAEQAALGATPAFLAEQWRLEADIVAWRGRGDVKGMITRINRWHFSIYRAAGMPHLVRMIEGLWLRTAPHTHALFPAFAARDRGRHRQVTLEALERHDGAAARRSMEKDIEGALDFLISRAAAAARLPEAG
ncbi:GntR family transcriptional regulator [Allostella vacuolata]|nr:GntR family transcriptional regulator [Stella vacuolata]